MGNYLTFCVTVFFLCKMNLNNFHILTEVEWDELALVTEKETCSGTKQMADTIRIRMIP